jgi:recombination protein RecT
MPETQIAVTEKSVGQYVNEVLPALIKSYAVRAYDGNAWLKTVALCIVENPDLMACLATQAGRISLKHALRFAATTGLSLNPQEGKAALVPINGKVNYWPMKNGLVELALNTGAIARIRMNAVRQEDHFRVTESMDGNKYEFAPNVKKRGKIIGFFCAIKLTDGSSVVEYMTREEMEHHRDTYGKDKRQDSAWNKSFEGMGIAKVTKRAIKRLALPPEDVKIIDAALADGETVEASFTETRTEKGTGPEDVERKLAEKSEPTPQKYAEGAPGPVTDPAKEAYASKTAAPANSQPAEAKAKKDELDIF